jgi:hypothetical protein
VGSGSRRRWSGATSGEYWDEGDIEELETLTLDASTAVENPWQALSAVIEAHTAQEEAELGADEDDD